VGVDNSHEFVEYRAVQAIGSAGLANG
jgi:hypothetical protein